MKIGTFMGGCSNFPPHGKAFATVCKMWGKKCKLKQNWKYVYARSTSLYLFNSSTQFKNFANKFALFFENYIREPFPFLTCPRMCVRLWGLAKAIFGLIRKTIENSIQQYDKKLSKNEEIVFFNLLFIFYNGSCH